MEILELKSTESEIKNSIDGLNSRMETTEKRLSEFEDRTEMTQCEQQTDNSL